MMLAREDNYIRTIQADAPVGYYPLNEGVVGTAFDCSGRGNHRTSFGQATVYRDGLNHAPALTATSNENGGVSLGYAYAMLSAVTLEIWAKKPTDPALQTIYCWALGDSEDITTLPGTAIGSYHTPCSYMYAVARYDSRYIYESNDPYQWHHLVGSYDGIDTIRFWIDGRLAGVHPNIPVVAGPRGEMWIGRMGGGYPANTAMLLQHAAIYDRVLTGDEVVNHYRTRLGQPARRRSFAAVNPSIPRGLLAGRAV